MSKKGGDIPPDRDELKNSIHRILLNRENQGVTEDPMIEDIVDLVIEDHFMWNAAQVRWMASEILKEIESEKTPKISKPEDLLEFDFSLGEPVSLNSFNPFTVSVDGVHHAQGGLGSPGVYLVKLLHSNGVFVLKRNSLNLPNEVLASLFLQKFGFGAPTYRLLSKGQQKGLEEKLRPAKETVRDSTINMHTKLFLQDGFSLMTFAPGVELQESTVQEEHLDEVIFEIGRLTTIDLVLNNIDRFPFLRRGEGNSSNVLLHGVQVIPIDSSALYLPTELKRDRYINRFSDFWHCVKDQETDKVMQELEPMFLFMEANLHSNVEFNPRDKVGVFIDGMKSGIHEVSEKHSATNAEVIAEQGVNVLNECSLELKLELQDGLLDFVQAMIRHCHRISKSLKS
eukprot:snap_masked-scaffold_33-processed-gene-0.36-mRNA-1 protein AED:1.00 eAED:1.00 QI:0/0/0/0/1/1/2/0/397